MIEFNHWDIYFKSAYDFFYFHFLLHLSSEWPMNKQFRGEGRFFKFVVCCCGLVFCVIL